MLTANLDCGGFIEFESFGLSVLQVDLQHIGQEEKRVSL